MRDREELPVLLVSRAREPIFLAIELDDLTRGDSLNVVHIWYNVFYKIRSAAQGRLVEMNSVL